MSDKDTRIEDAAQWGVPLHNVDPKRVFHLAAGLAQHVSDDAMLDQDTPLTYGKACKDFGIAGSNRALGKVLDVLWYRIAVRHGAPLATGFAAYIVRKDTGRPAEGWDRHFGASVEPEFARAYARGYVAAYVAEHGSEPVAMLTWLAYGEV